MVLEAQTYPNGGQSYAQKVEYYKKDNYNNGGIHKPGYSSADDCYSTNSAQMMPNPNMHSSHGPNHGYGGHHSPGNHHSHGHSHGPSYGNSHGPSHGNSHGPSHGHSMYPNHGPVNHGYGTNYGSQMPTGTNGIGATGYGQHPHSGSSGPHYGQQHKHQSWISKDLDD